MRLPSEGSVEMSQQADRWYRGGDVSLSLGESYEQELVPTIFQPWAVDLVARAAPQPGERILDVACGTGVVAREALRVLGPGASVTGVDLNAGMLNVARAHDPEGSIAWYEGSVRALPFPDAGFTLVLCQQGLQYFPDRAAALDEMRRVLVPGGRIVVSVWRAIEHSPGFQALGQVWARRVSPNTEVLPPFVLGEGAGLAAELAAAGFHDVKSTAAAHLLRYASLEDFVVPYVEASPLAQAWSQLDEPTRAAVVQDVGTALAAYIDPDQKHNPLAFPIETQYLTGWA
jgi:SAM-dependent methyltransferase